jgi:hypothetical protein
MPTPCDAPLVAATLRAALTELKTTLRASAETAIAAFERQTSLTPSRLEIDLVNVSPDGHAPYHIVAGVRVRLDEEA